MGSRDFKFMPNLSRDWNAYMPECKSCLFYSRYDKVCNHLIWTGKLRIYDPKNKRPNCGSHQKMNRKLQVELKRRVAMAEGMV